MRSLTILVAAGIALSAGLAVSTPAVAAAQQGDVSVGWFHPTNRTVAPQQTGVEWLVAALRLNISNGPAEMSHIEVTVNSGNADKVANATLYIDTDNNRRLNAAVDTEVSSKSFTGVTTVNLPLEEPSGDPMSLSGITSFLITLSLGGGMTELEELETTLVVSANNPASISNETRDGSTLIAQTWTGTLFSEDFETYAEGLGMPSTNWNDYPEPLLSNNDALVTYDPAGGTNKTLKLDDARTGGQAHDLAGSAFDAIYIGFDLFVGDPAGGACFGHWITDVGNEVGALWINSDGAGGLTMGVGPTDATTPPTYSTTLADEGTWTRVVAFFENGGSIYETALHVDIDTPALGTPDVTGTAAPAIAGGVISFAFRQNPLLGTIYVDNVIIADNYEAATGIGGELTIAPDAGQEATRVIDETPAGGQTEIVGDFDIESANFPTDVHEMTVRFSGTAVTNNGGKVPAEKIVAWRDVNDNGTIEPGTDEELATGFITSTVVEYQLNLIQTGGYGGAVVPADGKFAVLMQLAFADLPKSKGFNAAPAADPDELHVQFSGFASNATSTTGGNFAGTTLIFGDGNGGGGSGGGGGGGCGAAPASTPGWAGLLMLALVTATILRRRPSR
jgi:MYXO-CTERM domain-containing protein